MLKSKSELTFSVNDQKVDISGLARHKISVTIQLCCCNAKATIDNIEMNKHGSFPIKFYVWTLKSEFHAILTYHEIFFFCFFFKLSLQCH